jgi:hypothetical protein
VPKVTDNREEAVRLVASGAPVVLVGPDAEALGRAMASHATASALGGDSGAGVAGAGGSAGRCLLAVLVGDLSDPSVAAAAEEMAAELFPWAAGP